MPHQIRFDYTEMPDNELVCYVKSRFQLWQVLISKPVLQYVVHTTGDEIGSRRLGRSNGDSRTYANEDQMTRARSIAEHCVSTCADIITQHPHRYRHGGTWFSCHGILAQSLTILAAALSHGRVSLPADWLTTVRVAHDILLHWSAEAADVEWMRATLLHAITATCNQLHIRLDNDSWSIG